MAKKATVQKLLGVVVWLTGIIVSLAVAFGMINGNLTVPYIPKIISVVAGVIVVITTVLGIVLALIDYFG